MDTLLLSLLSLVVGAAAGAFVATRRARASAERDAVRESEARDGLRREFEAMSAHALRASQQTFLDLAEERLRRSEQAGVETLARREHAIRELVEPVARALDAVQRQTTEAERARAASQATLSEQIRQMLESSERVGRKADDFISALRRSDVRGSWGEVQLRRVVELAGMLPHVDFTEQDVLRDSEGRNLRPDLTVRLAGGRSIVVDSKVALVALIEAFETQDDAVRAERLQAHARHVRRHVDDLGSKRYWDQFASAPEFVVMFVPSEAFYQAALEQDPSLQEHAYGKGVVIATPTTLVAMLRTVAHAWKEDALARDAQRVLELGKELHDRLGTMAAHLGKVGRSLDQASRAYNQTVASLESRVMVSARRFGEMQRIATELPELEQTQTDVRVLAEPATTGDDAAVREPVAATEP